MGRQLGGGRGVADTSVWPGVGCSVASSHKSSLAWQVTDGSNQSYESSGRTGRATAGRSIWTHLCVVLEPGTEWLRRRYRSSVIPHFRKIGTAGCVLARPCTAISMRCTCVAKSPVPTLRPSCAPNAVHSFSGQPMFLGCRSSADPKWRPPPITRFVNDYSVSGRGLARWL